LAAAARQHDLIEFTLLKAYLEAGRAEEAQRLLGARRPGASGVPVAGLALVALSERPHSTGAVAGGRYAPTGWLGGSSRDRPNSFSQGAGLVVALVGAALQSKAPA
jgi:hypothetical protein